MAEEITIRESRRVKAALQMARLATIKTLSGFDFSFQPSLDRNRILALAQLDFIDRHEVVHFIGQSGTGKSHLAAALGVEAIRAGIRRAHTLQRRKDSIKFTHANSFPPEFFSAAC